MLIINFYEIRMVNEKWTDINPFTCMGESIRIEIQKHMKKAEVYNGRDFEM